MNHIRKTLGTTLLVSLSLSIFPLFAFSETLARQDRDVVIRLDYSALNQDNPQLARPGDPDLPPQGSLSISEATGGAKRASVRFQIPIASRQKAFALRIRKSDGMRPQKPAFNGTNLDIRPVRGKDGWYYLVPPTFLSEGQNTLEIPFISPLENIEMTSLEDSIEESHFARIFAAPVAGIQPEADSSQALFDVLDYSLDITVDMTQPVLSAASLTMIALSLDSSLQTLALDLDDNSGALKVLAADTGLTTEPLVYTHDANQDRLFLTLSAPQPAGTTFTVRVLYQGQPNQNLETFNAPAYFTETHGQNIPILSTLSEPYGARSWWPCKDIPDDKATMSMNITCPTAYTPISNGTLLGVTDNANGTHTYHWRESHPMSTYLASIACTNYNEAKAVYTALDGLTTMSVSHYVYPEYFGIDGPGSVNGTVTILEFLAKTFGEYPFLSEKYVNATFPWGGGMEHQTCTSMYPTGLRNSGLLTINVHETAHQWFGDKITMRHFDHLWLNEGFATYCEALFREETAGVAAYHALIDGWNMVSADVYPIVSSNADHFNQSVVYKKAAWVLHMLRHVVGDTVFFQAIRNYLADPNLAYGNALSQDLQEHFEALHGQSLDWFFDQWLYRAARPDYSWNWQTQASQSGNALYLRVEQEQSGGAFTMPVDLKVSDKDAITTTIQVFVDRSPQYFRIPLGTLDPVEVQWDPDNWILDIEEMTNPSQSALWFSALALDFGTVEIGYSVLQTLTIENIGTQALTLNAPALSGFRSSAFEIEPPLSGGFILQPGFENRQVFSIRFTPNVLIDYDKVNLSVSGAGESETITLRGRGKNDITKIQGSWILY